ncbi:MAB_1171c family putative transporter [Streptomyces sp. NPDC001922]|uniref:MAB_1171c family putative transporter n=1 Tax=Streptomyces sp. NPDC001922 TaxID=3364624 RepID=UPI003683BEFE
MLTPLLGSILLLALAWKASQLVRAPHDRLLQAVTYCLVCATLSFPLGHPAVTRIADGALGAGTAKLLQNVLLFGTVYWLMCFYLHSVADQEKGRRRARLELIPMGGTAVLITLAMAATPPGERGHVYTTADMEVAGVAAFYSLAGLYLCYALGMALWWTWRHARRSAGPLARGLWLVAIALAAMVAASAVREALVVVRWFGGDVPLVIILGAKFLLDAVAIPFFVIGVLYPGTANRLRAVRQWWRHRRVYHRLAPLWAALHEAFPEDAFEPAVDSGLRGMPRRRLGTHRRYYRRVIECRDGLVRLSPRLAELGSLGAPLDELPREVIAGHLRKALRAHAAGDPAPPRAVPIALPGSDSMNDDVRQLILLSDAIGAG